MSLSMFLSVKWVSIVIWMSVLFFLFSSAIAAGFGVYAWLKGWLK